MTYIVHKQDVNPFQIHWVENQPMPGEVIIRKMLEGTHGMLIEVQIAKGTCPPAHVHEHDSLIYLIKGKVKVKVGDQEGIIEAGDAVLHPAGIEHSAEALEDSLWIEVKAPPEETW